MKTSSLLGVLLLSACGTTAESPPAREEHDAGAGDRSDAGVDAEPTSDLPRAVLEEGEADSIGAASSHVFDVHAFEQPVATMSELERTSFIAGQATFQLAWDTQVTGDRSGLGPTFNAVSCEACHARNGRGMPPMTDGESLATALLRLSVPGEAEHGGPLGDPVYGDQLQPFGAGGVPGEGRVTVNFQEVVAGRFADGTPYGLVRPDPKLEPNFGAVAPGALMSLRTAQQTIGMGFLDALSDEAILSHEDVDDRDGDGISGRANRVWDVERGATRLGRFGWKASQPTVAQQSAAAFAGDVGITSRAFPRANCPPAQTACAAAAGDAVELTERRMASVTLFVRGSAVPARRGASHDDVLRGKAQFQRMGCTSCHTPSFVTGTRDEPWLSNVRIWPYSDLLLHDMGDGLADGRPDFRASGREWRTQPLWGLGLIETVSGHLRLLHDGRARTLEEAVLWHGGEAAPSSERFRTATTEERRALLTFLRSL